MSGLVLETGGANAVTAVLPEGIHIGGRLLSRSFAVGATVLIDDLGIDHVSAMTEAVFDQLLESRPDVVLIGTGMRRCELSPPLLYRALSRGTGVEVMDNAAAARTYNLLLGENRNVLTVFILPG
jgi:uncharacterized protein